MDSRQLKLVLELQDNASRELRKLSGELGGVEASTKGASTGFMGMAKSIAGVAAAYLSIQKAYETVALGVTVAADMQTAEIGLKTLLGSSEEAAATIARLKVESARTPFELPGLTQATQLLTSVTKDGDKSIDIILDIGEGLAAMGKGQGELDRIIVNLQQIAATGKAATIDIKQFAFAGIPIYEMLAETTGKTGAEVAAMVENGEISFELLTKMFDEANDAGGRFFNAYVNQAGSFNQASSNMKDSFGIMMSDIVTSSGLFDALTQAMIKAAETMSNWRTVIADITGWFKEHQLAVAMIAGAITAVLIPVIYAGVVAFGAWAIAAGAAFVATALAMAPLLIAGAAIAGIAFLIYDNWGGIQEFFVNLWTNITEGASYLWTTLTEGVTAAFEWVKNVFVTTINFIIGFWAMFLDYMVPGWDGMLMSFINTLTLVFGQISEYLAEKLASIMSTLGEWYEVVKNGWTAAWTTVKDTFSEMWSAITAVFSTAKDGILDMMDELLGPINKIIEKAERAMELAGKVISSTKSNISSTITAILDRGSSITGQRAVGGPVAAGQAYMVGERGPELLVPRSNGNIIPNYALNGAGMGQGGINITIYGDVSGEDVVDKVSKAIMSRVKDRMRI